MSFGHVVISNIVTEYRPTFHFWGFVWFFINIVQNYSFVWVIVLTLIWFTCHGLTCYSLGINHDTFFYGFVNMVSLSLSNTWLLCSVCMSLFPPVFTFDCKNRVESFLPFTSLNNLLPFLNLWDYNFGTSFAEKLDLHLHNLFLHQLGYWGIQM